MDINYRLLAEALLLEDSYRTITRGERITENTELFKLISKRNREFLGMPPLLSSTPNPELQKKLNDLSKKYSEYLETITYGFNEYIKLEILIAKKHAPVGTGSAYMNELCKIADEYNLIIVLLTAHKGYGGFEFKKTSSVNRLKNFYARFGFVSNYSRKNYRPDLSGDMHRMPKKTK